MNYWKYLSWENNFILEHGKGCNDLNKVYIYALCIRNIKYDFRYPTFIQSYPYPYNSLNASHRGAQGVDLVDDVLYAITIRSMKIYRKSDTIVKLRTRQER